MGIFVSMEHPYQLIPRGRIREEIRLAREVKLGSKNIKREKRVEKKSGRGGTLIIFVCPEVR